MFSQNLQKSKKAKFKDTMTRKKLVRLSKIDNLQPAFEREIKLMRL